MSPFPSPVIRSPLSFTRVVGSAALVAAAALGFPGATTSAHELGVEHVHELLAHGLFVPNRASGDVAVIDSVHDRVVTRIPVGKVPHQVIVSAATRKLIASNTQDDTISIIDLDGFETVATVVLDSEPEHMALSPDGLTLAVGNIDAGTVSLVSLETDRERARVGGLIQPHNLTFSPDGAHLYVANLGADHVSVVDVARGAVTSEIPVADPTAVASKGVGASDEYQGIINVTATPDGKLGFAAHGEGNTLAVIDLERGEKLTDLTLGELPWRAYASADGRLMVVPNNGERSVSIVATESRRVIATLPGAADMTGVNIALDGKTAFVISRGDEKVVVLDLETMRAAGEIALPGTPETGVITPDGTKLYIALSDADAVAAIDVATRQVVATIDGVGDGPWGVTMVGGDNYCH